MTYRRQMRRTWLVVLAPLVACGPDDTTSACKDNLLAGDLVITEVFADYAPPTDSGGTDDGKEWLELYNNVDRPVSLKGVMVVHSKIDGSSPHTHSIDDITLAPGQFFTLGNATQDLVPPYVDYGFGADLGDFSNSTGGKLALKCGDSVIDEAIYDTVKSGHSRQLSNTAPPDYTLNDDPVNWCEAKGTEFEPNNFGTPGQDNDCASVIAGTCSDNGTMRAVVSPAPGELVITEVMPKPSSPPGSTTGQWFEVKALASVDLNGLGLDRANDTSAATVIASTSCIHLDAGSYGVFARSTDSSMNGGLTALYAFPFSINPTTTTPDVQLVLDGTVIDAVSWPTSTSGESRTLDPDSTTATANDDPGAFCNSAIVYNAANGDTGTPGMANEQCAAQPVAGQCIDPGTMALRPIVPPAAGALVITEVLMNPAGTVSGVDAAEEWFEITNTSANAFDLNELRMRAGTSTTQYPINVATCKSVAPNGGFALFAHGTEPAGNGGLPPTVDVTFTFSLGQASGQLEFFASDGLTSIDKVTWAGLTSTGTGATNYDGRSYQLKLASTNTTDNDTQANFCRAEMVAGQLYGTSANYGTPRAANMCP